jgi:hypothetical protein
MLVLFDTVRAPLAVGLSTKIEGALATPLFSKVSPTPGMEKVAGVFAVAAVGAHPFGIAALIFVVCLARLLFFCYAGDGSSVHHTAGCQNGPAFGVRYHGESITMTQSSGSSHDRDQRLKVLLKEFFEAFFVCFFPAWASRFEFIDIDWLDKESTFGDSSWSNAWRLTLC